MLETLAQDLLERGKFDLSETFFDGTFVTAKKGLICGKDQAWQRHLAFGSGRRLWFSSRRSRGICFAATPVKLVERTVTEHFTGERPQKMISDKAYDSDRLDKELKKLDIELIAPHKANRKKAKMRDGRELRRYKRRWKIERLIAWLQNFRRIIVRYEYHSDNYPGFCFIQFFRRNKYPVRANPVIS